ncbi:hypothetical protein KO561_06820 [Radiobacillus kanasensis]|uniref:hypothetical protein n=1 Tax=Radiobacillus kanasensis TaxID=2844358 RepID=UPI001E64ADBD|nr:hypothetical protein [Radiobacillus kanasensis]UFU00641.1 hypothetical protein KO561_06820 [Radiobacillus kanasensis]
MIDINQLGPANLATISAIVAALVTVVGNIFKLPTRYRALLAIGVALVLVFLPQFLLDKVLTAFVIGLTASGVYSQVKPLKFLNKTANAVDAPNELAAPKKTSSENTTSSQTTNTNVNTATNQDTTTDTSTTQTNSASNRISAR